MHKLILTPVLLISISVFLFSCGAGGENGNQTADNTKYLARNVIFNASLASSVYADQSREIDTETQILAKNVIFEQSRETQIESDNVQDALEEISLELSDVIPGTWNIQNYNQESYHDSSGQVVINDDGTFNLISGSFAAIGMGSGTAQGGLCDHTEQNQTYHIYTEELIAFTHFNNTTENSVVPNLVKLRDNEIVFIGEGGCGSLGRQRISILSRVIE